MFFVIGPIVTGGTFKDLDPTGQLAFIAIFHAGWFVKSLWTKTLVLY